MGLLFRGKERELATIYLALSCGLALAT